MAIILIVVGVALCWISPWWIGVLIWIANFFLPDPIPYVDEIIALPGPIVKFIKTAKLARTLKKIIKK